MDVEELRALRLAHPFKPFNLVLKGGRRLPVDKSYYLGFAPDKSFLLHMSIGGGYERVKPEWVVAVDYDDPDGLRWHGRTRPQEMT